MVRLGAKRTLDAEKGSTPSSSSSIAKAKKRKDAAKPKANKATAKKKTVVGNKNNVDNLRTSSRSRKPADLYQTPESVQTVLTAISQTIQASSNAASTGPAVKKKQAVGKNKKAVLTTVSTSPKKKKPGSNKKQVTSLDSVATPNVVTVAKKMKKQVLVTAMSSKKGPKTVKKVDIVSASSQGKKGPTKNKTSQKPNDESPSSSRVKGQAKKKSKKEKEVEVPKPVEKPKSRSKKEALNPKLNVTCYEEDPTFQSSLNIPPISTLADSRLAIRAVLTNNMKSLKSFVTSDATKICSLCTSRTPTDAHDALSYAIKRENREAIKILLDADQAVEKKLGQAPDLLIHAEGTGRGSALMFGHGLRAVSAARGGKEGNAAFLKDANHYTQVNKLPKEMPMRGYIAAGIEQGISYDTVEYLAKYDKDQESSVWNSLVQDVDDVVRQGNIEIAGKLISNAMKRGGYGFNFLHEETLVNTAVPFTDFKPISVLKKSSYGCRFTPLHSAAINPNSYYLETLLEVKPEYLIVDKQNWTPVHYAAVCSGDGPLKFLIGKGVSIGLSNRDGDTPLHLAVLRNRIQNVRAILDHEKKSAGGGDSLEKANRAGKRPLLIAVEKGFEDIVSLFLRNGADIQKPTSALHDKMTPLMIACQHGHLSIVKKLVEAGAKVGATDKRGRSPVFHAVINGHAHILSFLLRLGVPCDVQDISGNTLAHYAAAYGWYFNMKLLLEAGCSVTTPNDWKLTPVAVAFMKGHIGLVELLVKEPGVEVNTPVDGTTGMTLLLTACSSASMQTSLLPRLRFLVDQLKSDCSVPDFKGNNALHHLVPEYALSEDDRNFSTVRTNVFDTLKFLIDHGCDINATNMKNETPFMLTCKRKIHWLSENMLDHDIHLNPSHVDSESNENLLHLLAEGANSAYVKKLYSKLSSKNLEALKAMAQMADKKGYTPLHKLFKTVSNCTDKEKSNVKDFVTFLVKTLNSDVNAEISEAKTKESILHSLIETNYANSVLPILLQKNVRLDPVNHKNQTPLTSAILGGMGKMDIAEALIKAGSSVTVKCDDQDLIQLLLSKAPSMHKLIPPMVKRGADVRTVDSTMKNSVLHWLVRNAKEPNVLDTIKEVVVAGADVNAVNKDGRTPLHLVVNARLNETDVVYDIEDFLLTSGAKLTVKDIRGRTPLHYAFVKVGKALDKSHIDPIELVMLLVNAVKGCTRAEFITMKDSFGGTALHYAAFRGATVCCSYFTSEIGDSLIDPRDAKGNTPFGLSVLSGHEGCALHFQQKGADFLLALDTDLNLSKDETVQKPPEDSQEQLLLRPMNSFFGDSLNRTQNSQNASLENEDSKSTWIWSHLKEKAAEASKTRMEQMRYPILEEVVRKEWQGILYLMLGKLQSFGSSNSMGIATAIKTGKLRLALKLIHRVKDLAELKCKDGTLLHVLAKYATPLTDSDLQREIVTLLLEKGVDPKQVDVLNSTPILYAAMNRNIKLVEAIVDQGKLTPKTVASVRPDALGRNLFSALFWQVSEMSSITRDVEDWITSLLSHGMCPNVLSKYPFSLSSYPGIRSLGKYEGGHQHFASFSPLIAAVIHGQYEIVSWLVRDPEIDINFPDENGRTPLMHAARLNDLKMVKLLLQPQTYKHEKDKDPWKESYQKWSRKKPSSENHLASVIEVDRRGWTAIDYLVCPSLEASYTPFFYAHVDKLLSILYNCGASFTKKSGDGLSPYERAKQQRKMHVVNVMNKVMGTKAHPFPLCYDYEGIPEANDAKMSATNAAIDAKKMVEEKLKKDGNKYQITVQPDKNIDGDRENLEVLTDPDQNIPFDCVLTKVDLSYGVYGLYNFYKMQIVRQPYGNKLVILFTHWGRVGQPMGQYQQTPFGTEEEAIKMFKQIFKAKSGNMWESCNNFQPYPKKYRLVHRATELQHADRVTVNFSALDKAGKARPRTLNEDVYNLVKSLANAHKLELDTDSTNPFYFDSLTKLQVSDSMPVVDIETLRKADGILNTIGELLKQLEELEKKPDQSEEEKLFLYEALISASEEFYALVPVYGFETEALEPILRIRSLRSRQEEMHRLVHLSFAKEVLLGAEFNCPSANPFDYIYSSLGSKVSTLDMKTTEEGVEGQLILQYIHNTSPKTKIHNIFKVKQANHERDLAFDNRWLLWHGTKAENVLSVLHSGLQTAPLGVDRMGELFGKGIYFADNFSKSAGYSGVVHGSNRQYIFLCEVALGKVQEVKLSDTYDDKKFNRDSPLADGCQSVKTADSEYIPNPGASIYWNGITIPLGPALKQIFPDDEDYYGRLQYNEYIVFSPQQVHLRYLIEFSD